MSEFDLLADCLKDVTKERDGLADALGPAQEQYLGWKPTAENINALPKPLFEYIYHLETMADPAGMVAENTLLKDQTKQLDAMIGGLKARIEQLEAALNKLLVADGDHMTACDRTMGASHPCTCGANDARQLLAGDSAP